MSDLPFTDFDDEWSKLFQNLAQNMPIQQLPVALPQQQLIDIAPCTLPPQPQPIFDNGVIQPAQQQFILPAAIQPPTTIQPPATIYASNRNKPTLAEINQTLARYKKYLPKSTDTNYKYRAPNSYIIYRLDHIKQYKNKRMSAGEINESIRRSWKDLSFVEKEPYKTASRNLQAYLDLEKTRNSSKQSKRKIAGSDKELIEGIKQCPIVCGEDSNEEMTVGVLNFLNPTQ